MCHQPVLLAQIRLREKTDLINLRPDLDAVAEYHALKKLEAEQEEVRRTWQRVVDHREHERGKLQVGIFSFLDRNLKTAGMYTMVSVLW